MPRRKKAEEIAEVAEEFEDVPCDCADGPCAWTHRQAVEESPPSGHRLRETGNGPNVSYEEGVLREFFGEPDSDGVYGKGGDNAGR
ncbi:hypothetical protein ACFWPU_01175 [Streptomyces sp. NPDC058471]|uniref:hypothetical protein n=1 Tax=Streptomyces sp. NPDC058471 TaxID=3346516 RepID=UPI003666B189